MQAQLSNPTIPLERAKERKAVEALWSVGLLSIQQSTGCGVDRRSGALQGTITMLTAEGVAAAKQWRRVGANTWEVPMARRAVVAVTAMKSDGQTAAAEFSWQWSSLHNSIDASDHLIDAEATFVKTDDGWRLNTSRLRNNLYDRTGKVTAPPVYRSRPTVRPAAATTATPRRNTTRADRVP